MNWRKFHLNWRKHLGWQRVHLILTWAWVLLLLPTILWWNASILFIGVASVYANVVSHWTAFQAAKAEEAVLSNNEDSG